MEPYDGRVVAAWVAAVLLYSIVGAAWIWYKNRNQCVDEPERARLRRFARGYALFFLIFGLLGGLGLFGGGLLPNMPQYFGRVVLGIVGIVAGTLLLAYVWVFDGATVLAKYRIARLPASEPATRWIVTAVIAAIICMNAYKGLAALLEGAAD